MSKFTLGADPELFLVDHDGNYIASCGLIGGTKLEPRPLDIGPGFAVQEDNVTVEYNIPPSPTKAAFKYNIMLAVTTLSNMVREKGLAFANTSAVVFPDDQLVSNAAREFGCDPDFNAWRNGKRNPRPKATDGNLRSCGGHIHVGNKFSSPEELIEFIKYMDVCLSVPSTVMDKGELRKQLYGKAGAYRWKPYGVEYRSLSNYWTLDEDHIEWAWDATEQAMDAWQNKRFNVDEMKPRILDAINNNNKDVAWELIEEHNLLVV